MDGMKTCQRIDDDICGHAIYAGDQRCPTCGRRLTMLESSRNLSSAARLLGRVFERNARELPRKIAQIGRLG